MEDRKIEKYFCRLCASEEPQVFRNESTWICIAAYETLWAENERLREANTGLHKAIEEFWVQQCGEHACGCDEHPECTHTFNVAMLRRSAMALDEPAGERE